jgi:hypothetical protein
MKDIHLNKVVINDGERGPWQLYNWKQGIFSNCIPHHFDKVKKIWMVVRGIVVWLLWLEYNDIVFNDIRWPRENILRKVWLGLIET